jgi:hypothetical protein
VCAVAVAIARHLCRRLRELASFSVVVSGVGEPAFPCVVVPSRVALLHCCRRLEFVL